MTQGHEAAERAEEPAPAPVKTTLSKIEQKVIEQALDYFYDYHTDHVCALLLESDPDAHYRLVIESLFFLSIVPHA